MIEQRCALDADDTAHLRRQIEPGAWLEIAERARDAVADRLDAVHQRQALPVVHDAGREPTDDDVAAILVQLEQRVGEGFGLFVEILERAPAGQASRLDLLAQQQVVEALLIGGEERLDVGPISQRLDGAAELCDHLVVLGFECRLTFDGLEGRFESIRRAGQEQSGRRFGSVGLTVRAGDELASGRPL